MKLKALKCPNCNAKLEIKPGEVNGTCPYCDSEFILDDEVIKVKHEIIDNTSLEIAETTLNKFKDYQKAEYIYRTLLYKYAHKEEVYIGLIRCITHDFKKEITTLYTVNEINDFFQKYTSLTTKTNIAKYSPSINEINRKFWLNRLNNETKNLTLFSLKVSITETETAWNKYILFSEEKEHGKLEQKYKEYITKLKEYQTKKKKSIKLATIITLTLIVIALITRTIYSYLEKPIQKDKEIKTSSLYKYCGPDFNCQDKSFIKKYFYPTIAELEIINTNFNKEKNLLSVTTHLFSDKKDITKDYTFKIVDNSGPYIKETACEFTDIESNLDLTKCFTIKDYTDGEISPNKAKINKEKLTEKQQGIYTIEVTATDKDKNKETKRVKVKITPTPIALNINLSKESIQINDTATLSYEITPDISNKEVTLSYDKNIIKVENNTITPLKIADTELCVTSNYDKNTKVCKNIEVTPICQNSYTFNFDGSKKEKIYSGTDFCAGTYKIYASVLNYDQTYFIHHYQADRFAGGSSTMTIAKFSSFLSDEGEKWSMAKGSYIETAPGITSITITK